MISVVFIPQWGMAVGHLVNAVFKIGVEQNCHRLSAIAIRVAAVVDFGAWEQVLEKVDTFNCLGGILSYDDSNWSVVAQNLHISQRKWGWFSYVIFKEGEGHTPEHIDSFTWR